MTTLPQRSPTRSPRFGGNVPAMAAPHGAVVPGQMPPQGGQLTAADVWRVIRSNLWLILLSLVLFGAAGVGLNMYLAKSMPRYTAQGIVRIDTVVPYSPYRPDMGVSDQSVNPVNIELEQRTQAQLLKQPTLMSDVLQTSDDVRRTRWFQSFNGNTDAAKQDLQDNLSISPIPDTRLISISMTARYPDDAKVIVDAITDKHLQNQRELNRSKQYNRSQLLNATRNRLRLNLQEVQNDIRDKAIRLSIDGMGVPGRLSSKEVELADLIKTRSDLQSQVATLKSSMDATQQSMAEGRDPADVEQAVSRDPAIYQYQQQVDALDAQIQTAELKLGPDHSTVKALQRQRDLWQQKLDDKKAEVRARSRIMFLDGLRGQVAQGQESLNSLSKRIDEIKSDLGQLNADMNIYLVRKDEEKDLLDNIKQVEQQLEVVAQTQSAQDLSGLSWMARPGVPDQMSFPRMPITVGLAVLLGLGLSLGIAFLREMTDTRIRSPRDIVRVGQMSLLGMIPHTDEDPHAASARLPLVIYDAPNSMTAEQLRQVRTRLQHAASLDTTRTILVTSPSPDDGKTTIACNLAAGLALNGRRILLVDTNFRRPQLQKVFELNNEIGLSDVLSDIDNFENAVHESSIPNLSVMTCGPKPGNPTELLESQLLIDFIDRALEEFDHVVFDSGPLLFVSESVALAARVDGVVTVVRARSNSRGLLQRMRDMLRQLKAEHLGVVLNGVHAQVGGYYRDNIRTYYAYQNGHVQ